MATGTDRDTPPRDANQEVPDQTQEPTPAREPDPGPTLQQSTGAEQGRHSDGADIAEDGPVRPIDIPGRSPGWTNDARMEMQQASANAWVKWSHEERQNRTQDVAHDAPEQQRDEAVRELPFFEGRAPRNFDELKVEHSEAAGKEADESKAKPEGQEKTLTFFEDRNPELDRTR